MSSTYFQYIFSLRANIGYSFFKIISLMLLAFEHLMPLISATCSLFYSKNYPLFFHLLSQIQYLSNCLSVLVGRDSYHLYFLRNNSLWCFPLLGIKNSFWEIPHHLLLKICETKNSLNCFHSLFVDQSFIYKKLCFQEISFARSERGPIYNNYISIDSFNH